MKTFFDGKKSYLVGAGMLTYAALGFLLGYQTADEAVKLAMAGAGIMGLRSAIAKQ